jgi:uncharacterized protein
VTISMYASSAGVFIQFLGNLSRLLDHAAAHAEARKIDPAIFLNTRLYPNMYNLTGQVGEANRHAVVACALISGVEPPVFPDTEPDISQLKARITTAMDFIQNLRPAQIDGAAEKEVVFTFRNGSRRKSPASRFCSPSAFRSSSSTSPRLTTSCSTAASISSRRIFWGRQVNLSKIDRTTFHRCLSEPNSQQRAVRSFRF